MADDIALVVGHNSLANGEPYSFAVILGFLGMQALKDLKNLVDVLIVESDTIVGTGNAVEFFVCQAGVDTH